MIEEIILQMNFYHNSVISNSFYLKYLHIYTNKIGEVIYEKREWMFIEENKMPWSCESNRQNQGNS